LYAFSFTKYTVALFLFLKLMLLLFLFYPNKNKNMKKIFWAVLLLPVLNACAPKNNTEKNIALVEKYVKAVENMDYNTMEALLDDDYYGYGPSYNDSIGKKDAVNAWKYNIENIYKSIKYNKSKNVAVTITEGSNKGEWVSNWGELHIVYRSGEEVNLWANTIYQIANGKIIKSVTFYNEADALRQLGYIFVKPDEL